MYIIMGYLRSTVANCTDVNMIILMNKKYNYNEYKHYCKICEKNCNHKNEHWPQNRIYASLS